MAPSATSQDQSDPLLPPKIANTRHTEPLSKTTTTTIEALGLMRVGLGVACLIAPRWITGVFQIAVPANMAFLVRLFGIREVVLGELLYTAEDKNGPAGGRRETKRALWANMASDSVDICSVALAVAGASMDRLPGALFVGAAGAFVVMGLVGLRGV